MEKRYENLKNSTILVAPSIGRWSGKIVDKDFNAKLLREAEADPDATRTTKNLMAGVEEYQDICRAEWNARALHRFNSVPWGPNVNALRADKFQDYMDVMNKARERFMDAVEKFVPNYPEIVERGRQFKDGGGKLGKLFREEDYPDENEIRSRFHFDIRVSAITDGSDFRTTVSQDVVEAIEEEARNTIAANSKDAVFAMYSRLWECVFDLAYVLEDPKKSFKDATIDNVRKLTSALPGLNIFNDPQIKEFEDKINSEILKFSPESLRENSRARASAAQSAREMERRISQYVSGSSKA